MGEDLPTKERRKAGGGKSAVKMTREERLAEELRANLKRRKVARRPKERDGEPPSDEGDA